MNTNGPSKDRVGRPRSEASTEAIIIATHELLEEKGYAALTIEAIASRAGVGKTTIYRWWPNKELLIMDVFLRSTSSEFDFDEALSIKAFFNKILISLRNEFRTAIGETTLSIVAQSPPESEIALEFYNTYLKPNRSACEHLLRNAVKKGEIRGDITYNLVLDMLFGPVYFRPLMYKDLPSDDYIQSLVNQVFDPIMILK